MALSECLYTKDQLQYIMNRWDCTEPVPKKGQQVVVCWPKPVQPNTAVITMTDKRSDYGKRLYRVVMGMAEEVFRAKYGNPAMCRQPATLGPNPLGSDEIVSSLIKES